MRPSSSTRVATSWMPVRASVWTNSASPGPCRAANSASTVHLGEAHAPAGEREPILVEFGDVIQREDRTAGAQTRGARRFVLGEGAEFRDLEDQAPRRLGVGCGRDVPGLQEVSVGERRPGDVATHRRVAVPGREMAGDREGAPDGERVEIGDTAVPPEHGQQIARHEEFISREPQPAQRLVEPGPALRQGHGRLQVKLQAALRERCQDDVFGGPGRVSGTVAYRRGGGLGPVGGRPRSEPVEDRARGPREVLPRGQACGRIGRTGGLRRGRGRFVFSRSRR